MTLQELEQILSTRQRTIVAIDGPSGSGKSTLAERWKHEHQATVFHTDDYFLPKHRKTKQRLSIPGGNFDLERIKQEIYDHLQERQISSHHYNCHLEQLEFRSPISLTGVIVIEGVYSMHHELLPYYDYTVFLEIDEENQLERILQRSNPLVLERFKEEWIPLENMYFHAQDIRKKADILHCFR